MEQAQIDKREQTRCVDLSIKHKIQIVEGHPPPQITGGALNVQLSSNRPLEESAQQIRVIRVIRGEFPRLGVFRLSVTTTTAHVSAETSTSVKSSTAMERSAAVKSSATMAKRRSCMRKSRSTAVESKSATMT